MDSLKVIRRDCSFNLEGNFTPKAYYRKKVVNLDNPCRTVAVCCKRKSSSYPEKVIAVALVTIIIFSLDGLLKIIQVYCFGVTINDGKA